MEHLRLTGGDPRHRKRDSDVVHGTPGARVSAAIALLDRAYGKAPTFSTSDTQAFKRAIDMTDDELAAIASGATLHVVK